MTTSAIARMDTALSRIDSQCRPAGRRDGPLLVRTDDVDAHDRSVPESARQRAVRDALDHLRYLGVADPRDLELALARSPLFVATWPIHDVHCKRFSTDVALVEGPGGDFEIRLAVFSGVDRLREWLADRNANAWMLSARRCWQLAMRLECAGVAIDPGHGSQYCFSRSSLERLASEPIRPAGPPGADGLLPGMSAAGNP